MATNTHILLHHPKDRRVDVPCTKNISPHTEILYPLRRKASSLVIKKCLSRKSLLKLMDDHSGEEITCLNGVIWITQTGNPEDIFLCNGETFAINQKGTILIQGMVETRLKIRSIREDES